MDIPPLNEQTFSETTLKGILLNNVDRKSKDPHIIILNKYLISRVDHFWDNVVVPLKNEGVFDGNKINWYFQIYKEGYEAKKVHNNKTLFNLSKDEIQNLVDFLKDKTLNEYLELGTSFLANSYALLTSWIRDQMIVERLEYIYIGDDPVIWVHKAEKEEEYMASNFDKDIVPGLNDILKNVGLIISRRV